MRSATQLNKLKFRWPGKLPGHLNYVLFHSFAVVGGIAEDTATGAVELVTQLE